MNEEKQIAETEKLDEHHWSGWPGAYCLKCLCEDPFEIALADGNFTEVDDDSEMGFHYEFPNVVVAPCPVAGELAWNEQRGSWDIIRPDGTREQFTKSSK